MSGWKESSIDGGIDPDLDMASIQLEELESNLRALDEDIPTPQVIRPREERDPDEEIAVIERYLSTKRRILDSITDRKDNRIKKLIEEISSLKADLGYYKSRKQKIQKGREIIFGKKSSSKPSRI